MHQFVVGEEYSFNAIAEVFGGQSFGTLKRLSAP
jgi:hypothetical protein